MFALKIKLYFLMILMINDWFISFPYVERHTIFSSTNVFQKTGSATKKRILLTL